jgi:hypothetical protein
MMPSGRNLLDPGLADAVVVVGGTADRSVTEALKVGKPVLVVGALAGSEQALDTIIRARRRSDGLIASSYRARFAPACCVVRDHFAAEPAPRNALICLVGPAEAALDGSTLPAL